MKLALAIIVLLFASFYSTGQDRKDLAVSLSGGVFNSPYYKDATARRFYALDFDYHLAKRHILAVNYQAGFHRYYDDVLSNHPGGTRGDGTNSKAEYRVFSVMYKYKIIDNFLLSLVPAAGAGVLTHTLEYPYAEVNRAYPKLSSWSDVVFPVTLDVNFKISRQWQAGLTGGFLFAPDYPVLGLHAGPKLSYIIR